MLRIFLRVPNCIFNIFRPQLVTYIRPIIMSLKLEIANLYSCITCSKICAMASWFAVITAP